MNSDQRPASRAPIPPDHLAEMMSMPTIRRGPSRRRLQWRSILRTALVIATLMVLAVGVYGLMRGWLDTGARARIVQEDPLADR